ncbi:MAG: hypothetical protein V1720_17175 [bacterium]
MNYLKFRQELKDYTSFSLNDIKKLKEKVYHHRLIEWQKTGYIIRIANGIYVFAETNINEFVLYYLANRIYEPSYVSLESALSYYSFIPESVYSITSVTAKKTTSFKSPMASFTYRKIRNVLMFGYELQRKDNFVFKIAEPEKAILDFFYFNPHLSSPDNFLEMRFNLISFDEKIDKEKLLNYLSLFGNTRLNKRVTKFLKWIEHAKY